MFKRKAKPQAETLRRERRAAPVRPAFSYYTSRPSEPAAMRKTDANTLSGPAAPLRRRSVAAQLPMWLLLGVVVICLLKLVALGTEPKVVVLDKSAVASTYAQPVHVYEAAAQKLLRSSLTNRTKLTANLDGTAAEMRAKFPELQAVSVALPLIGNRPIIYVQLAQPSTIVQTPHGDFALNKSGLALAKVNTLPSGVPLAVDQSGATPTPGKQYLPGSSIAFIQTVNRQLVAAKLPVTVFVLPPGAPYEIDIRLEGKPFLVRCNLQADSLTQSGAVIATLGQLGINQPGSYLDVRVPGRIYYK